MYATIKHFQEKSITIEMTVIGQSILKNDYNVLEFDFKSLISHNCQFNFMLYSNSLN